MTTAVRILVGTLLTIVIGSAIALWYVRSTGLTARGDPSSVETRAARAIRSFAIPADARMRRNPVPMSEEILAEGRAHFADHCAICHANDGSGNTEMGQNLFPRSPDMRLSATQDLTDGELFWIIENGIRFTGMPGWGTGTPDGEAASWHLVHFIRHLPAISEAEIEEMEAMNPRSPAEIRQEIEAERFLRGDDPAPGSGAAPHVH